MIKGGLVVGGQQLKGRGLTGLAIVLTLSAVALLPASASAQIKTQVSLQVFDEPNQQPPFIVLGGIVSSNKQACTQGRVARYYRLRDGSKHYLGQKTSNKGGVAALRVENYRQGSYLVKVKKKTLNNGQVCSAARAIGGLAGRSSLNSSASASAQIKHCQPIVKKIGYEPVFYKAKVLVTYGKVGCAEARRIIWKSLKPGGYVGNIDGWDCAAKGTYAPFAEKCTNDFPSHRVIKSSKPKPCRSCTRNVKSAFASALERPKVHFMKAQAKNKNSWKLCAKIYLGAGNNLKMRAKGVDCLSSFLVIAQAVTEPGIGVCATEGCEAQEFQCAAIPAGKEGGFSCTKDKAIIKLTR